jgi:hypothetical protein
MVITQGVPVYPPHLFILAYFGLAVVGNVTSPICVHPCGLSFLPRENLVLHEYTKAFKNATAATNRKK